MNQGINRRTFLKRAGQAGGLIAAGGTIESVLAACGGNISTTAPTTGTTPGVTKVASAGLKTPGVLQWAADFVSCSPYVFKDPKTPNNLVGFEVWVAGAMAAGMGIPHAQVR